MRNERLPRTNLHLVLFLLAVGCGLALPAAAEELRTYYGLLHAHTCFSDGSGTPQEAYAGAKAAGLDFFALTEHNHKDAERGADDRRDGLLIATDHKLYDAAQPVSVNGTPTLSVIAAARAATDEHFLGLYGQEFSTISAGNHVNVFEVDEVLTVANGDFRGLYERLANLTASDGRLPIVQFNHPGVHGDLFYPGHDEDALKLMRNDYGIDDGDLGPSFASMAAASDRFVALIEVLSGPATHEAADPNFHYDPHDDDMYFYLTQGFHVSPTAGQDNHYRTWGTITDARTGVLCRTLTREDLQEALRQRRTFATEDKNLDVRLTANGEPMGSRLTLAADEAIRLEVTVRDPSEPDTHYTVKLYHGLVEPQLRDAAKEWKAKDGLEGTLSRTGDGAVAFDQVVASGTPEFFYVKVQQTDHDRAWTAPIWVNEGPPAEKYVWSTSSSARVYHVPGCGVAKRIIHVQRGNTPPAQLTPHSCVTKAENEEP